MKASSLKPKHVTALVGRWKSQGLSAGTIKNRMTELRWWAEKVNKANVLARDNDAYGIARRQYATNEDKSRTLTETRDVRRSKHKKGHTMKLDDALRQLSAGRKTQRLKSLLPAIEQKLAEGITHREILGLLNANSFELTERTYKSYLYRYRKRRRTSGPVPLPAQRIEQSKLTILPTANGAHASVLKPADTSGHGRNRFEFNAGGLPPELLK